MPYTKKQQDLARAIEHGFRPTGKAKGFSKDFAEQVLDESLTMARKRRKRKK